METRNDAALGILRDVGRDLDELSWRYECEARGFYFGPDEFREIVKDLVGAELVRVVYEDPAFAEERYMESPDAWGGDWPESPPVYEAVGM